MKKNNNKIISRSRIPEALIVLGIFLMAVSGVYWSLRFRALSMDKE